ALRGTSVAVVGGDLYRSESWGIAPVAEGWRCARFGSELATSYAERTRGTATRYIEESLARHGDGVLFALQFTTQQDAA
ncbi:MAG TPA: hypothetical protein VGS03_18435, partial [Candidatus Polarisedimenticolia bacterium]|nr:hypothetical protein [Candidatus Polarisedimenticolia bacterium]